MVGLLAIVRKVVNELGRIYKEEVMAFNGIWLEKPRNKG
jgi:hypothetical protein